MSKSDGCKYVMIGDLHGNLTEARALWSAIEAYLGADGLREAVVVFLGDYCDRGPDTKGVLDFLIELKRERPPGTTHFIAGNHDFAFAAYLGCLPAAGDAVDLDATRNPAWTTGFYTHAVEGGMHYQGRRWGGSDTYDSSATFESYGVQFAPTPEGRENLIAAVPSAHKDFLRGLLWAYDTAVPFGPGRLVCVHAGLDPSAPTEVQLAALAARRINSTVLYENGDPARFSAFVGRSAVVPAPADARDTMFLVSGHHGFHSVEGNRFIIDASGGVPATGRPIQALVLPDRVTLGAP